MIITRTPLRVSFFGGGTDLPAWYRDNGGAVIATSINQYVYIQMRRLPAIFDFQFRVAWSRIEQTHTPHDIQHPVVRTVLQHYWTDPTKGLEIIYNADLPSRSGLGSSSAFTVALLHALHGTLGHMPSQQQLAAESIFVEQHLLKEPVGSQDQITTAIGGLNRIDFQQDDTWRVTPLIMTKDRRNTLEQHMMLFFTGFVRSASKIESSKVENLKSKQRFFSRLQRIVDESQAVFTSDPDMVHGLAQLLDEGWQLKRSLAQSVTNSIVDAAYETALKAGALGGKLLGAGGGGFILFLVPPESQQNVRDALHALTEVPIRMENDGSRVILFDPELTNNYPTSFNRRTQAPRLLEGVAS